MPTPTIDAIFVGGPKTLTDDRGRWRSSIARSPVTGPVQVTPSGILGDKCALPMHGGPDSALCVHLADHYSFWNTHYAMHLHPGGVGENLTLSGLAEDTIFVGDIIRLGTALAQVSGPRVPCAKQARHIGRSDWVKLTVRENRTGFYMRVLEPGILHSGAPWRLEQRLNEDASITGINRCMYLNFDPAYAQRMQTMHALGGWWREQAAAKLKKGDKHWTATLQHDENSAKKNPQPPGSTNT